MDVEDAGLHESVAESLGGVAEVVAHGLRIGRPAGLRPIPRRPVEGERDGEQDERERESDSDANGES